MRLKPDLVMLSIIICCLGAFLIQSSDAQISGCQTNTCKNGGTCIPQPDILYGFKCLCPPNYYGINCQMVKAGSGVITGGGSGPAVPDGSQTNQGGGSINIGGGGQSNPGGINIGGGSGGGGSINIGGGGNQGGGSINIGGGSSNNRNSICLNGGTFVRQGLPCMCPYGFSGNRCELRAGINGGCSYNPCKNGGICSTSITGNMQCSCSTGFTGTYCEYSTYGPRRGNSRVLGISLGSILPFLLFVGAIALCIYCCCCKNRNSEQPQPNRFVPSFFGGGGAAPNNRPFQPVQPMFANPRPAVYNGQPIPDPDEVFKTQSPPPYETVVASKPS